MGSLAGARRTQSSFPTFLASTNPSTLGMAVYNQAGAPGASIATAIAHLADVARVRTLSAGAAVPLNPKVPRVSAPSTWSWSPVAPTGTSPNRIDWRCSRVISPIPRTSIRSRSRRARNESGACDSARPCPSVSTRPHRRSQPGFGTPKVKPRFPIDAHVVGIVARAARSSKTT